MFLIIAILIALILFLVSFYRLLQKHEIYVYPPAEHGKYWFQQPIGRDAFPLTPLNAEPWLPPSSLSFIFSLYDFYNKTEQSFPLSQKWSLPLLQYKQPFIPGSLPNGAAPLEKVDWLNALLQARLFEYFQSRSDEEWLSWLNGELDTLGDKIKLISQLKAKRIEWGNACVPSISHVRINTIATDNAMNSDFSILARIHYDGGATISLDAQVDLTVSKVYVTLTATLSEFSGDVAVSFEALQNPAVSLSFIAAPFMRLDVTSVLGARADTKLVQQGVAAAASYFLKRKAVRPSGWAWQWQSQSAQWHSIPIACIARNNNTISVTATKRRPIATLIIHIIGALDLVAPPRRSTSEDNSHETTTHQDASRTLRFMRRPGSLKMIPAMPMLPLPRALSPETNSVENASVIATSSNAAPVLVPVVESLLNTYCVVRMAGYTRKSATCPRTHAPVWQWSCAMDVYDTHDSIELRVMDHPDRLGRDVLVGSVFLPVARLFPANVGERHVWHERLVRRAATADEDVPVGSIMGEMWLDKLTEESEVLDSISWRDPLFLEKWWKKSLQEQLKQANISPNLTNSTIGKTSSWLKLKSASPSRTSSQDTLSVNAPITPVKSTKERRGSIVNNEPSISHLLGVTCKKSSKYIQILVENATGFSKSGLYCAQISNAQRSLPQTYRTRPCSGGGKQGPVTWRESFIVEVASQDLEQMQLSIQLWQRFSQKSNVASFLIPKEDLQVTELMQQTGIVRKYVMRFPMQDVDPSETSTLHEPPQSHHVRVKSEDYASLESSYPVSPASPVSPVSDASDSVLTVNNTTSANIEITVALRLIAIEGWTESAILSWRRSVLMATLGGSLLDRTPSQTAMETAEKEKTTDSNESITSTSNNAINMTSNIPSSAQRLSQQVDAVAKRARAKAGETWQKWRMKS